MHSWAHSSSCAGTSTFVQGQISMRMTRRTESTRLLWQRSRPWDPRALPRGWSTLSWALALHSELPPCLAPGLSEHMSWNVFSLLQLCAILAQCKGAFHGPLRCHKGEADICGLWLCKLACLSLASVAFLSLVQCAQMLLEWHRSHSAWAASLKGVYAWLTGLWRCKSSCRWLQQAMCAGPVQAFCRQ